MDIRLLGALDVSAGGVAAELGPPKQRALLAILLLHVGEIVPVERLIELLWGEAAPRTADHSIQIYISDLRKALEPVAGRRLIHRRQPGYQLDTPPESVDANRFETLVRAGSAQLSEGERDEAIATLRSALELWRGPALSDFAYEEFAQPYVRRFHDLHLDAIEALAAAELDAGQAATVVPLLEAAIREDPLRERSRELLMIALYRAGRHAEALRTYEKLRELLVEELGLEPSPPLQQLRDRVLLHDASLLPAPMREPARRTARNPYKGLQPFGEDDADDFFGRDAIVERLLAALADGQRLIGLVGPSGSGKSSIVAAGLLPRLRLGGVPGSDRWVIAPVTLGPDPLADLQAVLGRIGKGKVGPDLALPAMADGARVVAVLDQFEQLFTGAEESRRNQFLNALAGALADEDGRLVVGLTLRADYYDRPLQHPDFAEVFVPGVVHVLPMTARELEAAVVAPAERVGVTVEPSLLAEVVAESVARPGSLPLLQYALTELFEQRTEPMLTLAGYTALGGLRGVLTRRAEATFLGLGPEEQRIATQVFLRLVRLGRGTADSRRRLMVSELTDLGIDAVALSSVLTAFGRHRLLTFDRDDLSGQATVELAHEALLTEWERLATWIDRIGQRCGGATRCWRPSTSGSSPAVTRSTCWPARAWRSSRRGAPKRRSPSLDGSATSLAAGLARRETEEAAARAQVDLQRRLEFVRGGVSRRWRPSRASRTTGSGSASRTGELAEVKRVTLIRPSAGELSALSEAGFDRAVAEFGLVGEEFLFEGFREWSSRHDRGARTARRGRHGPRHRHQRRHPRRAARCRPPGRALGVDLPGQGPRHRRLHRLPRPRRGIPRRCRGRVDLGDRNDRVHRRCRHRLHLAVPRRVRGGRSRVDPDVRILSTYLARPPDYDRGFLAPDAAEGAATTMYQSGADVIFAAAGTSGFGVFQAAADLSEPGRHLWAIGVDSDQYESVLRMAGAVHPEAWRRHILTSVLKRVDVANYEIIKDFAQDRFTPGARPFNVANGGLDIAYSGGHIEDIRAAVEAARADIASGRVVVPSLPADPRGRPPPRRGTAGSCDGRFDPSSAHRAAVDVPRSSMSEPLCHGRPNRAGTRQQEDRIMGTYVAPAAAIRGSRDPGRTLTAIAFVGALTVAVAFATRAISFDSPTAVAHDPGTIVRSHLADGYPPHYGLAGPSRVGTTSAAIGMGAGYPPHYGLAGPSRIGSTSAAIGIGAGYPPHYGLAGPSQAEAGR